MANRQYEDDLMSKGFKCIAGTDEAGRGPLAGPVVVAACVLPVDYLNPDINDSKQISEKKRNELYEEILSHCISYSVSIIDNNEIDKSNIYKCSQKGMIDCINKLDCNCDAVISDAMPLPGLKQYVLKLIHGDALSISVAAASIIAKVTRDKIMYEYDKKYPQYDFKNNKGYGTKKHIEAINKYGPTEIHRKTYAPLKDILREQIKLWD